MIDTIQRVLWTQLPAWARPTNAVFRYVRQQQHVNRGWVWRWVRWMGSLAIAAGLLMFSLVAAESGEPILIARSTEWTAFNVLYFPLVVVQGLALLIALYAVGGAITAEQRRGTWEAFKITSHGANLVIRARWAALFYQLRWFLVVLVGARLMFTGLMLIDLTDYQGYHLDLYIIGITPDVSLEVAVLLLAAFMAAALLQIVVLIGLNAALGLLIAVAVENRNARMLAYTVVLIAEWGIWYWSMGAGKSVLDSDPTTLATGTRSMTVRWFDLLAMGTFGDQGLRFMDLRTYLQTWADVEYGVLIGAVLLASVFVQVALTNGVLILAGRLASRPGNE
jgi:hypothetical protein